MATTGRLRLGAPAWPFWGQRAAAFGSLMRGDAGDWWPHAEATEKGSDPGQCKTRVFVMGLARDGHEAWVHECVDMIYAGKAQHE
ncbi:uncharacterized protein SCHCODRAFT_02343794 [Schizophyllum commune H4-8]|uniref:uncharacterized protein n=1 Tax=Schizophyllum commune (strain H4-8 / FGSC 9210) TaxID=578458 RepID=UPI0021604544|nr:uncharacterized protein SCHCODRAFT_02343794 [Schizophyllum commune H4-8]KAI5890389.1 hypothetical protein SCHCODRAFT_02343794 [Schizophyllum commune H4-8]